MNWLDILLYYGIFILSYLFFWYADKNISKKSSVIVLISFGILVLALFAGFRNIAVGIDTKDTIEQFFLPARRYNSLSDIIKNISNIKEPIYTIISYFLFKISEENFIFLFVMQLLVIIPIAIVAYNERISYPIANTMLIYMLLFYQLSFNLIRQSIAAAFLILALERFKQKKFFKMGIDVVLTLAFHSSGIIGIGIFIFIYIIYNSPNKTFRRITGIIASIVIVLMVLRWKQIAGWLVGNTSALGRYGTYVNVFSNQSGNATWFRLRTRTVLDEILRLIGVAIPFWYIAKRKIQDNQMMNMYKSGLAISFFIYSAFVILFKSYMGIRITIWLDYLWIPCFAFLCSREFKSISIRKGKILYNFYNSIPILFCIAYNFIIFMWAQYCDTVPYIIK